MIAIRLAEPSDISAIQSAELRAGELFADSPFPQVATMPGMTVEFLADFIARGQVWVAVAGGVVIGYAVADRVDDSAHLQEVGVDPTFGRRGIGTELIATVVEWARAQGDPSVTLSTFRDLPWNGPYYGRLGFAIIDEVDLTAELREVRAHEAEIGLPVAERVLMRLDMRG